MPFTAGSTSPTPPLQQWPVDVAAASSGPSMGLNHLMIPPLLPHTTPSSSSSSSQYHMFLLYPHTPFAGASRMPSISPTTPTVSRSSCGIVSRYYAIRYPRPMILPELATELLMKILLELHVGDLTRCKRVRTLEINLYQPNGLLMC